MEKIEKVLASLPFVEWDRYTLSEIDSEDQTEHIFYGWVSREKDSYKDFVVLRFYGGEVDWFTTSSAARTHEIADTLGFLKDDHNDCIRVEETFPNLPNKSLLTPSLSVEEPV